MGCSRAMRDADERHLLDRLRAGDERTFEALVRRHHAALTRVARGFVSTDASAEEVAQETWLAVVTGVERFEGRSSIRTWLFTILVNRARTRGKREARSVPFSSFGERAGGEDGPVVDPDRFLPPEDRWAGHWAHPAVPWARAPEHRAIERETMRVVREAMHGLPRAQRAVIVLHDVEGCAPEQVCGLLGVSEANRRVLLHRGRTRVRAALERHFGSVASV